MILNQNDKDAIMQNWNSWQDNGVFTAAKIRPGSSFSFTKSISPQNNRFFVSFDLDDPNCPDHNGVFDEATNGAQPRKGYGIIDVRDCSTVWMIGAANYNHAYNSLGIVI